MSDFIREVDEEYRRDRVVHFLSKYQVLLVGAVLAVIAGAAGYRFYVHTQTQAAEAANGRYDAALQLVRDGKTPEAKAAFDTIQSEGPAGYAMLARMKAVEALAARDPAAAARGFDAIAQDGGIDASFRETAQIRSAMIRVDSDDPKAFEKRYGPLAVQGFAYHSSMRELLALAAFKRNDMEAAGRWLDEIVIDQQAPSALRSRAEAFLSLVAAGPAEAGTPEPPKPVIVEAPPSTATPAAAPSAATTPSAAPAAATAPEPPKAAMPAESPAPSEAAPASSPPSSASPSPAGTPPAK